MLYKGVVATSQNSKAVVQLEWYVSIVKLKRLPCHAVQRRPFLKMLTTASEEVCKQTLHAHNIPPSELNWTRLCGERSLQISSSSVVRFVVDGKIQINLMAEELISTQHSIGEIVILSIQSKFGSTIYREGKHHHGIGNQHVVKKWKR